MTRKKSALRETEMKLVQLALMYKHCVGLMVDLSNPSLYQNSLCEVIHRLSC